MRIRVVVTAHGGSGDGLTGEMQKQVFVHHDPDLVAGMPVKVPGASTSSPRFVDLLGDGHHGAAAGHRRRRDPRLPLGHDRAARLPAAGRRVALVADGLAHGDGRSHPHPSRRLRCGRAGGGRPVPRRPPRDRGHRPRRQGLRVVRHRSAPGHHVGRTPPTRATTRPTRTSSTGPSRSSPARRRWATSTATASWRSWPRPWTATSTPGTATARRWPASRCCWSTRPRCPSVDPVSHEVTFTPSSGVGEGGELVATPTVADVNGDGRPEIVVGAQEQYVEPPNIGDGADVLGLLGAAGTPGNSRLYVISPDGTDAHQPERLGQPRCAGLPARVAGQGQPAGHVAAADRRRRRGHARGGGRRRPGQPGPRDRGRLLRRAPCTCSTPRATASTARPRRATTR